MIVAIVAIHGVYNKQKIINAYAFKLPNPAAVSAAVKADIPSAELILLIPYKTEKLDTTTSFAEMPEIRATAICQLPRPAGRSTGSKIWPKAAAKLCETSETNPSGPEFKTNHKTMDAINVGKPIHLSEITITAPDTTEKGRMMQAIIARNLYRKWFSIKPMMGITWWNVVDDCGAPGEPSMSGLFTRGMNPKPAYYALNNLINKEWKTVLTQNASADGTVKFRGFKGKYRLSWKDKNGAERFAYVHVK